MGDTVSTPSPMLLLLLVCLARILGDVLVDAGCCCSHGDMDVDPEDLRKDRRLPGLRRRVLCVPSPGIISSSLLKLPLAIGAAVDAAEYEYFERGIGSRVGVIAVELRGDLEGRLRTLLLFWGIVILMGSTFMGGKGADGNGGGVAKLPGSVCRII